MSQNDDLISRQDAIDALDCIGGVEEVLRSLPSAQPEIIHCRECRNWINHCCYERKHIKTGFYTSGAKYCA